VADPTSPGLPASAPLEPSTPPPDAGSGDGALQMGVHRTASERTEDQNARSTGAPGERAATVMCVANQKGGVGKTTTTVSLAAALAQLGAKVLIVDLDPQGNATTGLGLRAEEGDPGTYRVLVDSMPMTDARIVTDVDGLDVIPSSIDLAGAEVELVSAFSREMLLRRALESVRDQYDVVFIDCPPSLGLLTVNALVAADQVLVPIQCEYYALEGVGQLMRTVQLVGDNLNRELQLGGVVLTMYDGRTNLSQQVVDEVRGYFGARAFQTVIPRTVRLSEAPSFGQPITVFDPHSRGSRAYQRLAGEVADRLELAVAPVEDSALDRLLRSNAAAAATADREEA
jgi:chromosome partitioning protein